MKSISVIALSSICCTYALAQESELRKCADVSVYSLLDFWVGQWDVYSKGEKVGENRIEKILDGCAVLEHWTAAGGGQGKSLFYVGADEIWQQIWVSEWSANPGGMKEKTLIAGVPDNGVRFQGELRHPEMGTYLDRTTPIATPTTAAHRRTMAMSGS